MAYQNINQYVYNKWYLINRYTGEDISLASDERDFNQEVVFSPYVIGVGDGNTLPININFNSSANTQTFTLDYNVYDFDNIVVGGQYWTPENFDPNCITAQTLCDIGLTGTDNGLVTGMTGQSITITNGVLTGASKFDRYSFGREMKFHQVSGYTSLPNHRFSGVPSGCVYSIVTKSANTIGTYQEFYGGFYQGFYKLFGFEYEALPTRMHRGWSVEMLIKPRFVDEFSPPSGFTTLNAYYPQNENIFFYLGTRAENKYWHHASGKTSGYTYVTKELRDLVTCACANTGVTNSNCDYVYPPTGQTTIHGTCGCEVCSCSPCPTIISTPEHDPLYDSMSNAIALRLSGDPKNPSVCVRVFRMTGDCEVTGTCVTGRTSVTGYTFEEFCSSKGIYDYCSGTTYSDEEHWVQIDAVWERKRWYDTCDLVWKGGLGVITSDPYSAETVGQTLSLIMPPTTDPDSPPPQRIEIVELNNDWLLEKDYRLGTFKIYVNGMPFFIIDNFEEIIPRGLDTIKERQIGVPFNMSIGGGTQGLHENLVFSAKPTTEYNEYIQDPQLFPDNVLSGTSLSGLSNNIYLEKYFAGTFDGGISQVRFYNKPLLAPEIQHNFRILKNDYQLFNPFCPSCPITPTPTPTVSPTNTLTPTITPTNTLTPTQTATPITPTPTPTQTASPIPQTPTRTPTPTSTPIPFVPGAFTFDADYIVFTYSFTDGNDLDTRTRVIIPDIGQTTWHEAIGWCDPPVYVWPPSPATPILTWGGDNTGVGFESTLIDLIEFKSQYPGQNIITINAHAFWYGTLGNDPVTIRVTLYKGGTMVADPGNYTFYNDTFTAAYGALSPGTVVTENISECVEGENITSLQYNLTTFVGQFI